MYNYFERSEANLKKNFAINVFSVNFCNRKCNRKICIKLPENMYTYIRLRRVKMGQIHTSPYIYNIRLYIVKMDEIPCNQKKYARFYRRFFREKGSRKTARLDY